VLGEAVSLTAGAWLDVASLAGVEAIGCAALSAGDWDGACWAGIAGVADAPELLYADCVRGLSHAATARAAAATTATGRRDLMAASSYLVVVVVVLVDFSMPGLDGSIVVVEDVVVLSVVVLLATGGGVVVLGTTTVVSLVVDAVVGAGVVVEVVVVRSHAASDAPMVRAATRGSSFMFSPYGS
jgi:hypothetical protein